MGVRAETAHARCKLNAVSVNSGFTAVKRGLPSYTYKGGKRLKMPYFKIDKR